MSDPVETSRAQFDRQAACYGRAHILRDVSDVAAALDGFDTARLSPALDVATGADLTMPPRNDFESPTPRTTLGAMPPMAPSMAGDIAYLTRGSSNIWCAYSQVGMFGCAR